MLVLDYLADLWPSLRFIIGGVPYTVALVAGAMVLGFLGGLALACMEVYGSGRLKRTARIYVWFFRGVPVLLLLFLFHFGVFSLLSDFVTWAVNRLGGGEYTLDISVFVSAILVLGLISCAYQSQIFRGSILSLPVGQYKAAQALGFGRASAVIHIILPQALRISIPAWSNEYSILLKDSAVAFALGVLEIMARSRQLSNSTSDHLTYYIFAAFLYYLLTWLGVKALRKVDEKTRIPGLGHEQQSR